MILVKAARRRRPMHASRRSCLDDGCLPTTGLELQVLAWRCRLHLRPLPASRWSAHPCRDAHVDLSGAPAGASHHGRQRQRRAPTPHGVSTRLAARWWRRRTPRRCWAFNRERSAARTARRERAWLFVTGCGRWLSSVVSGGSGLDGAASGSAPWHSDYRVASRRPHNPGRGLSGLEELQAGRANAELSQ